MKLGHLFLLLALGLAIPPNYREECAFLQSAGLEDMIDVFHGEEIELGMMDKLTDEELKQLGFTSIGSRHRFRAAVGRWLQAGAEDGAGGSAGGGAGGGAEGRAGDGAGGGNEGEAGCETGGGAGVGAEEGAGGEEGGEGGDGAGGGAVGGVGAEDEEEEVEEGNLVFYTTTMSTGRTTHHFLHDFYRFDRNKVKTNGKAFFQCSVRGCRGK